MMDLIHALLTKMSQLGHYETIRTNGNKFSAGVHPWSVGTILLSSLMGSFTLQLIVCPVSLEYFVCGLKNLYGYYSLVQRSHHYVPITLPTLKRADHLSHFS